MYNRDSRIMRRLLGRAPADATAGDASLPNPTSPLPPSYRPSQSQNAVYPAGVPIACLDVAPDRRAVVLGGAHILKTVVLDSPNSSSFSFSDGVDIRAAITAQKSVGPRGSIVGDQLNIRDVKWHGNASIFTACATGKIFAYDLARLGTGTSGPLECIQIQEDSRQVNSLDINPHLQSWLLSGSQDGVARVFDVSSPLHGRGGFVTFRQRFAALKCNDPVRQVRWSPRIGHEMACCTEGGVVLKWDVRQPSRPLLRINAHEKACSSISWHPDGVHLISAGRDTKLHVWDLGSTADKRQKPKWTISTPAPVSAIAWRPGLWSASAQSRRVAQVAVTYDESSNKRFGTSAIHIWDLARPTMPYKEIDRFDAFPSALSWQDQDMLWTVGQDGLFNQCDVAFAPKVIDRQSTSAMAFSPRGDVVMFLDERQSHPRPRPIMSSAEERTSRSTYGSSPASRMLSVSKSDSEDDDLATFLGPRRITIHRRRLSGRSGQHMSTTPPSSFSLPDDPSKALDLEQSINMTGIFKLQQAMASGPIPAAKPVDVYQYLSTVYLETIQRELPAAEGGKPLIDRVGDIMEQYAQAAENANLYRLSQTWRILAYAVTLLMKKRAQYHLELRIDRVGTVGNDRKDSYHGRLMGSYAGLSVSGDNTPRRPSAQASIDGRFHSVRSLLSEEIESTSNVPTPIARPVDEEDIQGSPYESRSYQHGKKLTPILEPESFDLGPSAHASYRDSPRHRLDSEPISERSNGSEKSQYSITEGYDFYDAEVLAKAIDVPFRSQNGGSSRTPQDGAKKGRQDSTESFSQVFSISSGTRQTSRKPSIGSVFAKPVLTRHESELSKESSGESHQEYESRIRGEEMEVSPKQTGKFPRRKRSGRSDGSTEDMFMISQTTGEDAYQSQTSYPSHSDSDFYRGESQSQSQASAPGIEIERRASSAKEVWSYEYDQTPHIIETDYLPWDDDPEYPFYQLSERQKPSFTPPSPLDPYLLLQRTLEFESRKSALDVAAMVLLLRPLVPEDVIDTFQASSILRQYHMRLMRMGFFVEAALLRNLSVKGWPAGLPEWGESYGAIYMPAQQGVKVGLLCSSCRKPRELESAEDDMAVWTCENCSASVSPCAVCNHLEVELPSNIPADVGLDAAPDEVLLSRWWYCPGCGHGGHSSCLYIWHSSLEDKTGDPSSKYSDGACPLDGCGHACLPGKYRGEMTTARAEEVGRAAVDSSRSRDERRTSANGSRHSSPRSSNNRGVKSDGNDVPQSKAVGKAREALNRSSGSAISGGILSSSPGRVPGTGDRERRKSVKFANPNRE